MRASILKVSIIVLALIVGTVGQSFAQDTEPVTTTRDAQGIWFIEGGSLYDVYEAMGYAVATDRLWQMDTYRRAGRGTLAEMYGESALEYDVALRTMGYSEEELTALFEGISPDAQTVLQGYVDGINRRIAEFYAGDWLSMPFEYWAFCIQSVLLEGGGPVLPTPWVVEDVLAWMTLLGRSFDGEGDWLRNDPAQPENYGLLLALGYVYGLEGQAMFGDLRWVNDPSALTIIPSDAKASSEISRFKAPELDGVDLDAVREAITDMRTRRERLVEFLDTINADVDFGSYGWTISGDKTASGNPMLYSGPQMGFDAPSIVGEGSIRGGGLEVSGMFVPGAPAFWIGRTPHHAWALQTGHAHTVDFYFEVPQTVFLHRMETFNVLNGESVTVPIFRSSHGPIINPIPYNPADPPALILSWAYGPWGREANVWDVALGFARAESVDEFGAAVANNPYSFHIDYADRDGNIAYWMSGFDPIRAPGSNPLVPQLPDGTQEWTGEFRPNAHDRNNPKGWYGGWNNKAALTYPNGTNSYSYYFGPANRAHVINEYLDAAEDITFEEMRDLALNVATTSSVLVGGNTWSFVADAFKAAVASDPNEDRNAAVAMLDAWDGHFVAGGPSEWRFGAFRADAWVLQDAWIDEVMRLVFEDEFMMAGLDYSEQPMNINFNVLLRALAGGTFNNWFQDRSGSGKPTTANELIVLALDNVIADIGLGPYNAERGTITYSHSILGLVPVLGPIYDGTPYSNRSTYAHAIELDMNGPMRIESMFPLGESGAMYYNGTLSPTFDPNFFSMVPAFDSFMPRPFPLFE
jgi:penicillin amidase